MSANFKKTSSVLKKTNSFEILRSLYISGVKTRGRLSNELHLSLPTISRAVEPYLGSLITIEGKDKSTGGRRPEKLIFNYLARKIGGVQVDKNFFIISLSNLDRKPIISEKVQFDCTDPRSLATKIHNKLLLYLKKHIFSAEELEVLTIAVAGTVSTSGMVASDSPLKWEKISANNFFLDEFYQNFPNCTVLFENDANALAIGELADRGYGKENLIGLYLGKGIGVGIIINGRLYSGTHGRAGEIGKFVPLFENKSSSFENFFNSCKSHKKSGTLANLLNNLFLLFDPAKIVLSWNDDKVKINIKEFQSMAMNLLISDLKWEFSKHGALAIVNGALAISGMMFLEKKVYGQVGQNYMLEMI